jgi:hypothetical protein
MPDLNFRVEGAEAVPYAAAPQLAFKLRIGCTPASQSIYSVVLRCQIRIDPARRHYRPGEQEKLRDLFGDPPRWGQTLRPMLWTHSNVMVPGFVGEVAVDLPVACTFDFNVAVTKFFHALEDGEVPLLLLFSGTIFHEAEDGLLQVAQVPWEKEASFRLPVGIWKEMMEHYYPGGAWLCLRHDIFDRLYRYKVGQGLPTWEQALEKLLESASRG